MKKQGKQNEYSRLLRHDKKGNPAKSFNYKSYAGSGRGFTPKPTKQKVIP